ncbi:MAG: CRISPR-associated endoribonuclease Cas6, partial [Fervidobacterium sp.]
MRIMVEFCAEKLPVSSNFLFLSYIKEALMTSNYYYFKGLFYYGERHNKITKSYTYAVIPRNFYVKKDELVFNNDSRVEFILSTPDYEFVINLYNGILRIENFSYKDYRLKLKKIRVLKEKVINTEEVVFNALSPICIKNKQGKYLDIKDPEFNRELNYVANLILKNYRGYGL